MKVKKRLFNLLQNAKDFGANESRKYWRKRYRASLRRWKLRNFVLRIISGKKIKRLNDNIASWEKKNFEFDKSIARISRKEKMLDSTIKDLIKLSGKIGRIHAEIKLEASQIEKKFRDERSSIMRIVR